MPRLSDNALPSYRHHKASGQALVTLNGTDVYLGEHNSPASREKYNRTIAEWIANGRRLPRPTPDLTVLEIVGRFWQHAEVYYRKPDGTSTSETDRFRDVLKVLSRLYGSTLAREFGPLALKAVRGEMIRMDWCRKNINRSISRIRHVFKWAAENELVPASVHHGLAAVAGLKVGRSEARESEPVKPVPVATVHATLPHVSSPVAAMIRLQLLTGMRPGEACMMRGCDLETPENGLWLYKPASHKTKHHGHERLIYIGPQAKRIVQQYLKPNPAAYLFSPADADAERRQARHAARETPKSCGNCPGDNKARKPRKAPGNRYSVGSYGQAIDNACELAFPLPEHLARVRVPGRGRNTKSTRWETPGETQQRLGPERWAERLRWIEEHRWHPNQLRHTAATELRRQYGIEAAQVILGHRTLTVTEIYAEKNVAAAKQIMGEVG